TLSPLTRGEGTVVGGPSPRLRGEGGAKRRVRGAFARIGIGTSGAPHPPFGHLLPAGRGEGCGELGHFIHLRSESTNSASSPRPRAVDSTASSAATPRSSCADRSLRRAPATASDTLPLMPARRRRAGC